MSVCHHSFEPSAYECYDICGKCGSYWSRVAPPAEKVYTPEYWSHERGHSTPEEQAWNCESYLENGISKNDFLLQQITVEKRARALEIGCSPGSFVHRLVKDACFDYVLGIDPLAEYSCVHYMEADGVAQFMTGLFPSNMPQVGTDYDLIVASDVFEHSHRPWPFLAECSRLLKTGGQLLMMLPVVGLDDTEMPERMFHPEEHVWLHSASNLTALLGSVGFHSMTYDRWTAGHETVSAIKGQMPEARLTAA